MYDFSDTFAWLPGVYVLLFPTLLLGAFTVDFSDSAEVLGIIHSDWLMDFFSCCWNYNLYLTLLLLGVSGDKRIPKMVVNVSEG